ncbi:MAG: hypothetical protein ABH834_00885 [Candidatus Altiarchaeota archaeon]
MGKFAPNNRDKELRVEKLFLRDELVERLDSKVPLNLDDFMAFFWHMSPVKLSEHTHFFLGELIQARRDGRLYTQDDWARFKKVCTSGNNRNIILRKLLHLGVIERKKKTQHDYVIFLSDKWIHRLELLITNWVMLTE